MSAPEVREELRLAIKAELEAILSKERTPRVTQTEVAVKMGVSQAAVYKAVSRGELGRDFAERFTKAYRLDEDELVRKHGTRVTAWDVAKILIKYPDLAKTIESDTGRWSGQRLVALARRVRDEPPLAAPDGRLTRGSWREMLDTAEDAPAAKVGGVAEFRRQIGAKKGQRP